MPDAVVESPTVNSANKTPPLSREILPCKDANSFKHESNLKEMAVSLGVVNSRVLCGALPEYPKKLKDKNISGEVKISVGINEAGEVSGTNFISGDRSYSKPAQKAAYQTKFAPVLIEGKARRAYGVLIYEFDGKQGTKLQEINQ
jgi:outer membrane biosynthesis protein TonB